MTGGARGGGSHFRSPSPPPPSGCYLIRGRKVGGNWGVGCVRLGTQAPSIHLEGKRRWHHHKVPAVKVYTQQGMSSSDVRYRWACMCGCVGESERTWGRMADTFPVLTQPLIVPKFLLIQQYAHFCGTSCLLTAKDFRELVSSPFCFTRETGVIYTWHDHGEISFAAAALTSAFLGFTQAGKTSVKLFTRFCFLLFLKHHTITLISEYRSVAGGTVVCIYAYLHSNGLEKSGLYVHLILWQQDKKKKTAFDMIPVWI